MQTLLSFLQDIRTTSIEDELVKTGIDVVSDRIKELAPGLLSSIKHDSDYTPDNFADKIISLVKETIRDLDPLNNYHIRRWRRGIDISPDTTLICDIERIGKRSSIILVLAEYDDPDGEKGFIRENLIRKWAFTDLPGMD